MFTNLLHILNSREDEDKNELRSGRGIIIKIGKRSKTGENFKQLPLDSLKDLVGLVE